jgi:hypothetical protein
MEKKSVSSTFQKSVRAGPINEKFFAKQGGNPRVMTFDKEETKFFEGAECD